MANKTQVNIQVTEDRKDRWEKAVDESPESGTLSGFIRGAVEARIEGQTNEQNGTTDNSEALNEILEATQDTKSTVSKLEGRVSTVENLVRGDPEAEDMADRIFGVLPTREDLSPLEIERRSGETVVMTGSITDWPDEPNEVPAGELPDDRLARSGHLLGLAEALGESPYDTEQGMEELTAESYVVGTTERNGETLYYREE